MFIRVFSDRVHGNVYNVAGVVLNAIVFMEMCNVAGVVVTQRYLRNSLFSVFYDVACP